MIGVKKPQVIHYKGIMKLLIQQEVYILET